MFLASLRRSFRLSRRGKKTNKSMYECKKSEQYDTADVPTYEEVAPYCRANGAKHRLVVMVGKCGYAIVYWVVFHVNHLYKQLSLLLYKLCN